MARFRELLFDPEHRFLVELQDSTVNFICCDMPDANRLTIGLMANIADYERQLISERTKAAMTAAKARGIVLGNPRLAEFRYTDTRKATAAQVSKSRACVMAGLLSLVGVRKLRKA